MKKVFIVGVVILILVLSGCRVSNYLKGEFPSEKENTDKEDIDSLIQELTDDEGTEPVVEETATTEDSEEAVETIPSETTETPGKVEGDIADDSFVKLTVQENEKVKLNLKTEDADKDKLTYKFTEPLDEKGEWQTNYGDAGNYLVTVTVSDGKTTTTKKVLLVVERVNVPPTIEGVDSEITISEGDVLNLKPQVRDPNGDAVTVTISDPVGNDGKWETGYTDRGAYDVVIKATDGELESTQEIKLTVNKKNVAPIIEMLSDITINEGESVEIEPVVSDPNGDDVTITISDPIGDDGAWETGYTDNGKYEIVVKATDGDLETVSKFTLTVNDINKAPEIIDISLE